MSVAALRQLVNGYQVSQAIHVAAVLGLADLVAEGPRTSDELAAATGTNAAALYRLLRALASVGIFVEHEGRRFELAELGRPLRSDVPESLTDWAAFAGRRYYRDAWSSLIDSVRTGENAFRLTHGVGVWEYRARRPDEAAIFDRAMAANSRVIVRPSSTSTTSAGSGRSSMSEAATAHCSRLYSRRIATCGASCSTGRTSSRASTSESVAKSSAATSSSRCPRAATRTFLKWILHDWEDAEAIAILRTIRRHGAAVVVVERDLGPPNEAPEAKLSDLNMLVGPGGRERTAAEFATLFARAGYELVADVPTASGLHVFEGGPVPI